MRSNFHTYVGGAGLYDEWGHLGRNNIEIPGLKKKPSTSELLDWLKLLVADDIPEEVLQEATSKKSIPPLYGALLKNEQDIHLFEKLAFMARR